MCLRIGQHSDEGGFEYTLCFTNTGCLQLPIKSARRRMGGGLTAPPSLPLYPLPNLLFLFGFRNNDRFKSAGRLRQLGDIIVAIDDQEINTEADLFKILESRQPGDIIAITAQRWRVDADIDVLIDDGGDAVMVYDRFRRRLRVSGKSISTSCNW